MKTNAAPEKIFLFENPINGTPDDRWLSKRSDDEDIEYTRTDAFIDKACDWIEDHIYEYLRMNRTWNEPDYDTKLINDLRKAMKGE